MRKQRPSAVEDAPSQLVGALPLSLKRQRGRREIACTGRKTGDLSSVADAPRRVREMLTPRSCHNPQVQRYNRSRVIEDRWEATFRRLADGAFGLSVEACRMSREPWPGGAFAVYSTVSNAR